MLHDEAHYGIGFKILSKYSKLSIIRPGFSRLLEFEKKDRTGCLIETFSKTSRPGHLIEPKNWAWQP